MDVRIKYSVISLVIIILQSILKLYGVIITGSLSFLSETIDTIIDILFASLSLYSLKQSIKPPDYEHMYGHSKIDPIGALAQGIVLMCIYSLLIFNTIQFLILGDYDISNPDLGILILIISFLINIVFSRYLIWKGRKIRSLIIEVQGLNLFQDSMRAIIVLLSFVFSIFGMTLLDPIFSIVISIWIIIGALNLAKKGINDLTDVNPINSRILEDLRINIFSLEHVIAVQDLKVRATGNKLFIEVRLSVEDHISVIHANEITKSIQSFSKKLIPFYDIDCIIEMNPLVGEDSLGESIINQINSMLGEFPEILEYKNVNLFRLKNDYFLSMTLVVDNNLSLREAHQKCTDFENIIKTQSPNIKRIITHIESTKRSEKFSLDISCEAISEEYQSHIKNEIEELLRKNSHVKGYHGLECWTAANYCIFEIHIFFEGSINIALVHHYTSELEEEIRNLKIKDLQEIIIHAEPVKGRTDGVIFANEN
ncbi:MAG: cation diffusion facilitator family transporter [Candidatus Lokiarchaeota archaeon]|nr:cation diffusion facilitator family transporter [Candidatus Lokiarchaeota archaeon]MBD3339962.1 cation diffusion facilitator family transporter [Candidatus Lokiarchaeota archaeon]